MIHLPSMDDDERAYCTEMRILTVDRHGQEVFVGLDRAETEWLRAYLQNRGLPWDLRDKNLNDQGDRFIELQDKHDLARQEVLIAENEARSIDLKN